MRHQSGEWKQQKSHSHHGAISAGTSAPISSRSAGTTMPITAVRSEEVGDVAEVEVGSAEVLVRVDAHDRVEEPVRERKGVRFGVHGYDEVFDTGVADAR